MKIDFKTNLAELAKSPDSLQAFRQRILRYILIGTSVLGVIAYLANLSAAIQKQEWVLLAVYGLALGWIVVVTLVDRIAYPVRAFSILIVLYLVGLAGLLQYGLNSDARVFLMTFTILATILMGTRGGVFSLGLNVFTMLILALAMSTSRISPPAMDQIPNSGNFADWVSGMAVFLLLGTLAVSSLSSLVGGIAALLTRQKDLTTELEGERSSLESKVNDRTANLERRLIQIRTAAELTRTLNGQLDPQTLLFEVVNLIRDRFDLYYVGLFLVDDENRFAVLRAGTGEAGRKMLTDQHKLLIGGSSMIGWSVATGKARIALDVGQEAVRFNNPNLPDTHSEMAVPLIGRKATLGALTIQSRQVNAFDDEDATVLQGIADAVAISLENARLFEEVQSNLEEIRSLHRQYLAEAWSGMLSTSGQLSYTFEQHTGAEEEPAGTIKVPLMLRDQVLGQITLETSEGKLSTEDMAFIESITNQTALALENARLLEETQRRVAQEKTLNELSAQFSRAMQVDDILRIAVKELGKLPAVAEASVFLEPPKDDPTGKSAQRPLDN